MSATQADLNISAVLVFLPMPRFQINTQGRPIQVWVNQAVRRYRHLRALNSPQINVWPTPDGSQTYQFVYWRMRRIQDAGGGTSTQDIPFRFLTCLVSGLAYYLALKIPEALNRLEPLKQMYDEAWDLAAGEDREKAPDRLVPRRMYIS
jgi:hypothetical protein